MDQAKAVLLLLLIMALLVSSKLGRRTSKPPA